YANVNQINGIPSSFNSVFYDKENNTIYYINTLIKKGIDYYNQSRGALIGAQYSELIILFRNHPNLSNGYGGYETVGVSFEQMDKILNQVVGMGKDRITQVSEITFEDNTQMPNIDFLRKAHYFPLVENG